MSDLAGVFELRGTPATVVTPAEWQRRADELRSRLVDAGLAPEAADDDLLEALSGITFRDTRGASWRHDGRAWWLWSHGEWESRLPPPQLLLEKVEFAVDPSDLQSGPGEPGDGAWEPPEDLVFTPTHLVPPDGIPAWDTPDPSTAPAASLDGLLDVERVEQRTDGWALVRCANGWTAWVDGAALLPAPPG